MDCGFIAPNFNPEHWTDAQIFKKNYTLVDLEAQVKAKFDKMTE